MVTLTNALGLPDAIVRAVQNDPYSRGDADISVTGLIAPARMTELMRRHGDELTEDVADRLWALLGQITHGILERSEHEAWTERRFYIERHGWRISGQFDRCLIERALLQDYKLTSTYTVKEGPKPEWIAQQSLYRLILAENGFKIDRAEVVVMFRDWSRGRAKMNPAYPQLPFMIVPIELWSVEKTEKYIHDRLLLHSRAHIELPQCTAEERWERPGSFAIRKPTAKRALVVVDTMEEAIEEIRNRKDDTLLVEQRHPVNVRCADYCPAAPVCSQWQSLNPDRLNIADTPVRQTVTPAIKGD